jgi:hypothetical protein
MINFDELFENAIRFETIEQPKNEFQKNALKAYYNFTFNVWLQNFKGWEYGNEKQYVELLTKQNWKEFIAAENLSKETAKNTFFLEKLSWQQVNELTTEKKIVYFKEAKCCVPFRELHHTIVTVCEFVKLIYPNIEPLKYFEYFFSEIDFDKIENNSNKAETLKYCNAIYYGLEQLLKADISKAIFQSYQKSKYRKRK